MTVLDIGEKVGSWFDMDGGGRVQLRTLDAADLRVIRRHAVKKGAEYKRIDGKAERFEFDVVDEDLQNELFWDRIITAWENLIDGKGAEIPCTKENKVLLMSRSAKFAKLVAEALKLLAADESAALEQAAKN